MKYKIGFIGFGEAAYHICKGLKNSGIQDIKAFDTIFLSDNFEKKKLIENRLYETGVMAVKSLEDLLLRCEILFLAVPAKFGKDICIESLPKLTSKHMFIDITTNKPNIKKEIGEKFSIQGVLYVDAAVMGAVPLYQHKTPMLVCGNGAEKMINIMKPIGMSLQYLGIEAGKAVKIKLTRSVFVKGIEALTLETLFTARKLGIEKEIMNGLELSFQKHGFIKFVEQLVTSNVQHSERRAIEANECIELQHELGVDTIMMEATKRKLNWSASLGYEKMVPVPKCDSLEELYLLWTKIGM